MPFDAVFYIIWFVVFICCCLRVMKINSYPIYFYNLMICCRLKFRGPGFQYIFIFFGPNTNTEQQNQMHHTQFDELI